MLKRTFLYAFLLVAVSAYAQPKTSNSKKSNPTVLKLSLADYNNKTHAIWVGQIIATLMGLPAEHDIASVKWIDEIPPRLIKRTLDDDWYYEMIALKGFEKHGAGMTAPQLGQMWKEHNCGSWGSSAAARHALNKGIPAPQSGHPLHNPFWWTIGPQFSADIYGALAPGMPNVAARMAREYGHVNGYAEGVDGAVFVATAISLGFIEKDTKTIVRKAASMIDKQSPYRQCLDMVIQLAEQGKTAQQVLETVENKWHIEYPATNNAVANGGIVAACLWFGEGDFLKTVNLASRSLDYTDSDCNAANVIGVIMAMKGLNGIPKGLMEKLGDRVQGNQMGTVVFNPPVDESITELGRRTAKVGAQILLKNGASLAGNTLTIPVKSITPLPAELFKLADYTKTWNPDWQLVGAGFANNRGSTYLEADSNVLVTYPRDETRRLHLHRTLAIDQQKEMTVKVAAPEGKSWELVVYIDDELTTRKVIEGSNGTNNWQKVVVDLAPYKGQKVKIRLFQNLFFEKGAITKVTGNAFWKEITIK